MLDFFAVGAGVGGAVLELKALCGRGARLQLQARHTSNVEQFIGVFSSYYLAFQLVNYAILTFATLGLGSYARSAPFAISANAPQSLSYSEPLSHRCLVLRLMHCTMNTTYCCPLQRNLILLWVYYCCGFAWVRTGIVPLATG